MLIDRPRTHRAVPEPSGLRLPDIQHACSRNVPPGTRTRGHEPIGDGVSTVTPPRIKPPGLCGHRTNDSCKHKHFAARRACALGTSPLRSRGRRPAASLSGRDPPHFPMGAADGAPLARGDGCPPCSVCDRRPTALLLASYACLRCVREDDDADPIVSQMVPTTMVLMKAQTPD